MKFFTLLFICISGLLSGGRCCTNFRDSIVRTINSISDGNTNNDQTTPLDQSCFQCQCPRMIDYQCGSDGRTYQNECMFNCAKEKCLTKDVVIETSGQCVEAEESTTEVTKVGYKGAMGEQSKPLNSSCFLCKCPRMIDFQCGSDGRTYQSECLFNCAKEKCPDLTKDVVIETSGQCDIAEESTAVTDVTTMGVKGARIPAEVEALDPSCFYCPCKKLLDYQCGSDGRNYQNKCLFDCAKEKCPDQTRDVIIENRGQCKDSNTGFTNS